MTMINISINIENWDPEKVVSWLKGLKNEKNWFDDNHFLVKRITGKALLLLSPCDLADFGIDTVDLQEFVINSIEKLSKHFYESSSETLQSLILNLSCKSRALQQQLTSKRKIHILDSSTNNITSQNIKQRVSIDTLNNVSEIITVLELIIIRLNRRPFFEHGQYRSMKSLLIALGIELTSTAQRDQFVDRPNDIIEKCAKSMADYCDRILLDKTDPLFIQAFSLECVRIKRKSLDEMWGISLDNKVENHIISKINTKSPAGRSNFFHEGDEIVHVNSQTVIGWTKNNVVKLLSGAENLELLIKRSPKNTPF